MEANKVNLEKLYLTKWYFKIYGKATHKELKEVLGLDYPYTYITKLIQEGLTIESKTKKEGLEPYWVYTSKYK